MVSQTRGYGFDFAKGSHENASFYRRGLFKGNPLMNITISITGSDIMMTLIWY
jgi:hypothetical protein